jgi:3-isopropylmalate/(R)-2-methylmalate dehydratase small subunit
MKAKIEGRVHRLGHNIHVDQIYPSKYLKIDERHEMAKHILEGYEAELLSKFGTGDIIVAGRGFGHGPHREQAAIALRSAGIECIIANSYSRSFYRSAVNNGLAPIECKEAFEKICDGESIAVDIENGQIVFRKGILRFPLFPDYIAKVLASGGLIPHVMKSLGK